MIQHTSATHGSGSHRWWTDSRGFRFKSQFMNSSLALKAENGLEHAVTMGSSYFCLRRRIYSWIVWLKTHQNLCNNQNRLDLHLLLWLYYHLFHQCESYCKFLNFKDLRHSRPLVFSNWGLLDKAFNDVADMIDSNHGPLVHGAANLPSKLTLLP